MLVDYQLPRISCWWSISCRGYHAGGLLVDEDIMLVVYQLQRISSAREPLISWFIRYIYVCNVLYIIVWSLHIICHYILYVLQFTASGYPFDFSLMRQHSSYCQPCEISLSQPVGEKRISRYFSRKNVMFRKIVLHHGSVFILINKTTILPHKYFFINLYIYVYYSAF